jgi:hypothetical protein
VFEINKGKPLTKWFPNTARGVLDVGKMGMSVGLDIETMMKYLSLSRLPLSSLGLAEVFLL